MVDIEEFDPKIKKIEEEIIDRLINSSIGTARDEFTSKILLYFITRKNLTQRKLQELTGISIGKISQEVNGLIENGLISKKRATNTREYVYTMQSIQSENFSRGVNLVKTSLSWEGKFLAIKKELEENKVELQNLNGYDKIKVIIEQNLRLMASYKKFLEFWYQLQQKFEANLKL